jgi:putative ABC transport system ATP-binding protein
LLYAPGMIRLEAIGKTYSTEEVDTRALTDIHLNIEKGEFVSISGPSGSGKSTLLSILGLLDVPTVGSYHLNGTNVVKLGPAEKRRVRSRDIGVIFQTFNLIHDLTVSENIELPLYYAGMKPAERRERVRQVLNTVGLDHQMKHLPGQLSGGQQQRVAVARAVACRPSLLLADEPTGNLDSETGAQVLRLLQDLHREGATLCMVTHEPGHARHADRTVHLCDGRIVDEHLGAGLMGKGHGTAPVRRLE